MSWLSSLAWQTCRYLLKHPGAGWGDVPELPKAAVQVLSGDFVICTSRVMQCQHSADGETSKLLLELQDGLQVEAVIMRYDTTGDALHAPLLHQPERHSAVLLHFLRLAHQLL